MWPFLPAFTKRLTAGQLSVYKLQRKGKSVKEIADALGICESNVYEKLRRIKKHAASP